MIIIAHNIRSLYNVGSIFRNCASFNAELLYLTGITGTPPRKEIAKVALGAEQIVKWEQGEVKEVIQQLKQSGYKIYGLEITDDAVDITNVPKENIALVLGNEVEGIDSDTMKLLDGTAVIKMGEKKSLNVSVASGIALYEITK